MNFKDMKNIMTLILMALLLNTTQLVAQDYRKQVDALRTSFAEKNSDAVKPYIGEELSFGQYPAGATLQILNQVVNNLKLNSLEILEQKNLEAKVRYSFTALGKRESKIHFDQAGKITRLELVDNLLHEQAEAQKALAAQKQAPTPGQSASEYPFIEVQFPSKDGLLITGNLYEIDKNKPVILLCHQAGYNKYEYADIAPKLNQMGFNVMAIDQRSGGSFAGKDNETLKRATEKGLSTEFLDAEQDMEAAVDYLNKKFKQKVILWGSSYSSSLTLFVAQKNKRVKAAISFSPGDYFGDAKKSLAEVFPKIKVPFLVTSSNQESQALSGLLAGVKLKKNQSQFIPEGSGYHGSRALWEGQKGGEEYWNSIKAFLTSISTN